MENYLLKKLFILRIFFVLGLNTQGKKNKIIKITTFLDFITIFSLCMWIKKLFFFIYIKKIFLHVSLGLTVKEI